jgi:DNA repair exonuclease SbcCD ATPase subunit
MRRTVFLSLGVLEFLVALVLLAFAWQLPGPAEVGDTVGRVERVSKQASGQVRHLREQVALLRERRPQLQALTVRLQQEMRVVNAHLRHQQLDPEAVRVVGDALGEVAQGLDGLSATLDPKGLGQAGAGLKAGADFLDGKVAPGASEAADRLEKVTADLTADAKQLGALLRESPPDLKALRAVLASLAKFEEGLGRTSRALRMENASAIREGFAGLEMSLKSGAQEVERVSGYTYPVVTMNGLRPSVEQRPFWSEGRTIAEGMRKAAKGVTAAGKEVEGLNKALPELRASLESSRKVVTATRQALESALKQQEKVAPLLKSMPERTARLAEELPKVGNDLVRLLRETARLKEVAALLRQAQKGVDDAARRWPQLRKSLGQSAVLLRGMQKQLRTALANRAQYESALRQTLDLTKAFAAALPLLTEQMGEHLEQQERSLAELGDSIDHVSESMPAVSQGASRLLLTTRWLLCLVALTVSLHAAYLLLGARLGAQYGG